MNKPVIEISNLSFSYNGHEVLSDINLTVNKGDFVAVTGPNGGGKTTLLKLVLGLLKPDRGKIMVFGKPPGMASYRIGYVPQDVHINRNFPITVMDVVKMGLLGHSTKENGKARNRDKEVESALEKMGVKELANKKMGTLSGGQRQRVFIARALAAGPELMLLDEPTASIDTGGQIDFFNLLEELNREVTIVIVSHDILVASRYARSMACVNRNIHYHLQEDFKKNLIQEHPLFMDIVCPVDLVASKPFTILRPDQGDKDGGDSPV